MTNKLTAATSSTSPRLRKKQGDKSTSNSAGNGDSERRIRFMPSLVQVMVVAAVALNALSFSMFRCAQQHKLLKPTSGSPSDETEGRSNLRKALDSFTSATIFNSATEQEPDSSFEDTDDDEEDSKPEKSTNTDAKSMSLPPKDTQRPHCNPTPNEKNMPPHMNWTIVVSSNGGFEHVFLNWYNSFVKIGLNKELPLILIADDEDLYRKYENSTKVTVKKGWEASEKFTDASLNGDYRYGTRAYKKLVSRRPALLLEELERGKDVLYIDIDTVLRGDPRPFFKGDYDFWGQKHRYLKTGEDSGRPTFCTGFLALRSTKNTKTLIRDWRDRLESGKGGLNQGEFNKAVYNCAAKETLRAKALDEKLFPTGNRYKKFTQKERDAVIMMHNNYCRGGDCKQTRMEEYGLWDPAQPKDVL